MAEVLDELAAGTLDGDDAGLDGDLDCNAREESVKQFTQSGDCSSRFRAVGSGRRGRERG